MRFSWMIALLALMAPLAGAQGWLQAYDKGLTESRAGRWGEARTAFKQAAAYRTEDQSNPTSLPGPATERRLWRGGAPYSPNFLSAYSAYRLGAGAAGNERSHQLRTAAQELEALHAKNQFSPESFYFLNVIYTALADSEKRIKLDERFTAVRDKVNFKVDTEAVAPEERAAVNDMMARTAPAGGNPSNPVVTVPSTNPPITPGTNPPLGANPTIGTRVATIPTKFALVIGNTASRMAGMEIPFASDDAQRVREALTTSVGYPEENVDLVLNATASQIMASARALAERVPQDGTVFIYFAGTGVNLDGKDFLAGVDTESATDSSSMAPKAEILRLFMQKGAKVFSFFQVNRPTTAGRYFGMEVPLFGFVSQAQATMPGDMVFGHVRNGKTIGLYTDALVSTLNEFRSNQVPIMEFGWQVFNRIRRGDTGRDGGSSRQTPTLPVLTNMASDAKF